MCAVHGGIKTLGEKDRRAATALLPETQPNAAQTYIITQCRFIITQESDLEVCADKFPIDPTLTGIFLDILQYCAGFAKELLTWSKAKRVLLRVRRECTAHKQ